MSVIDPKVGNARYWLDAIAALPAREKPFRILNVCGGHERSISEAGIRTLLPKWIELVPGPGCPVCVCSNEDLLSAIQIARSGITLVAYGDMLRVPTNDRDSLLKAKAEGASVHPVASPIEAIEIAQQFSPEPVVFFAAGFETSFAPLAAVLNMGGLPENLSFLLAGKLTWPAVELLLKQDESKQLDALIAPGHVAAIMGAGQWQFCLSDFGLPTAVSGFTSESLLQSIYLVAGAQFEKIANAYPEVVSWDGNKKAQQHLADAFDVVPGHWRGLGVLPDSAYQLKPKLSELDARIRFPELIAKTAPEIDMPKGCRCADVVMARCSPAECPLFGSGCTPQSPQGPCMVSDEGACHIWHTHRQSS